MFVASQAVSVNNLSIANIAKTAPELPADTTSCQAVLACKLARGLVRVLVVM